VLDQVERGRFLVQPAREHSFPAAVGPLDVELNEGSGQLLALPRGSRLAGAQAHDRVAHAHRLAGLEPQVADDAVAFVEQAEDGDPVGHRRHSGLACGGRGRRLRLPGGRLLGSGGLRAVAAGEQANGRGGREQRPHSGVHGS